MVAPTQYMQAGQQSATNRGMIMPQAEPAKPAISFGAQTFRELVGLAGAGLAGYGAWLHYAPAGYMVAGGLMVGLAVIGTIVGRS